MCLTDNSVLHFIRTTDIFPLSCVAMQNSTRIQGHKVWWRAVSPVSESHRVLAKPLHVFTWQDWQVSAPASAKISCIPTLNYVITQNKLAERNFTFTCWIFKVMWFHLSVCMIFFPWWCKNRISWSCAKMYGEGWVSVVMQVLKVADTGREWGENTGITG